MHNARAPGFTLIEVLITVAIIAILTAIAVPSYQTYIRQSARNEAAAFIADLAVRQQQILLTNRAYADSVTNAINAGGLGVAIPKGVNQRYTITVAAVVGPPPTFTITAAPKTIQVKDTCGTLGINQAGTKTATGNGTCW